MKKRHERDEAKFHKGQRPQRGMNDIVVFPQPPHFQELGSVMKGKCERGGEIEGLETDEEGWRVLVVVHALLFCFCCFLCLSVSPCFLLREEGRTWLTSRTRWLVS